MKKLFTLALCAFATYASAQQININTADGNVIDKMSMIELYQMTHSTGEDGEKQVMVELLNGASYTLNTEDITSTDIKTKDDMLHTGRYANMRLLKDFNSIQDLEEGDLIGIFSEADYDITTFIADAYSVLDGNSTAPIVQNVPKETIQTLASALNTAFRTNLAIYATGNRLSSNYIRFHVANIVYVSKDIDGTKIPLSARLIYPYSVLSSSPALINNIYVEQHTTLFEDNAEPSAAFYPFSCSGMVFQGSMVAQPDLLGFGISNFRSQMFVDKDVNGSASANLVIAAKQYIDRSQTDPDLTPARLRNNAYIISAGSSQGASTALGFTYYMENILPAEKAAALPKVTETRLCAGAYTPQRTFEEFVKCDSVNGFLVPVIVSTAVTSHPEYMRRDDGTTILPYEFLNPALKTMTWEGPEWDELQVPPHMTIWDMLNSMRGNSTAFTRMFKRDFPYDANPNFASFSKMIADGVIIKDADGNPSLNYADTRVAGLKKFFEANDLTNPNLWVPRSNIKMLHSINDATVPFINSRLFYDNMASTMFDNGNRITLDPYANPNNMNHVMICLVWMISEVTGLPTSTIFSLMGSM